MTMTNELQYIPDNESDAYVYNTDLGLSAALIAKGFDLVSLDTSKPKARFIFKTTNTLNKAIQDYWNGKLDVDAINYFNVLKRLKSQIYSSN
jgi:hypothetical protein